MTELLIHRPAVLAVAMAIVRDRGLAEDVVQDTFVIALAKHAQLRDETAVASWLHAIARNRARDVLRARRREHARGEHDVEELASADDPELALADATRAAQVRRTIATMPPRYRNVLLAFYGEGKSAKAIAAQFGISEAATLQRLSRGRKMVAERDGHLRELAILVIALIAARRADAAVTRPRRLWLATLGVIVLASWSDLQSHAAPVRVAEAPPPVVTAPAPAASAPASPPGSHAARDAPVGVPPVLAAPPPPVCPAPASPPPSPARHRAAVAPRATVILQAPPAPIVPVPATQLAEVTFEAPPAAVPLVKAVDAWYAADGLLDSAAMPRAGSSSIEMQGLEFIARRGITEHLAVHAGFTAMDMRTSGASMDTTPVALLGLGLKAGATLRDELRVSAIVEGSREWHTGTTNFGDRGIVRAYASLTFGTARANLTLHGGVFAVSEGDTTTVIPMVGFGMQLGFADHAALVLENQYLTAPLDGFTGSTVIALRAHTERGDTRVRADLGTLLVQDGDRSTFWPWFQVGIGW